MGRGESNQNLLYGPRRLPPLAGRPAVPRPKDAVTAAAGQTLKLADLRRDWKQRNDAETRLDTKEVIEAFIAHGTSALSDGPLIAQALRAIGRYEVSWRIISDMSRISADYQSLGLGDAVIDATEQMTMTVETWLEQAARGQLWNSNHGAYRLSRRLDALTDQLTLAMAEIAAANYRRDAGAIWSELLGRDQAESFAELHLKRRVFHDRSWTDLVSPEDFKQTIAACGQAPTTPRALEAVLVEKLNKSVED